MAQKLNSANTLHGIFNLTLNGQTINGTTNSEIWSATPNKNRTTVLKSTIDQLTTGSVTVTNGKQQWQYDPKQNVVYTGSVPQTTGTSTTGGILGNGQAGSGGQAGFLLGLVQSVFTQSDATLRSSNATVDGKSVYDLHVVPSASGNSTGSAGNTGTPGSAGGTGIGGANFNYDGEVYVDRTTQLPVQVNLQIQGFGNVVLDIPTLDLNSSIPDSTFTFTPPTGAKVLPFTVLSATPQNGSGTLTLQQAQQQAGYHLLSIPASETNYTLNGVNVLGSPGSETYTLNYLKGNLAIVIAEGKPLANLPGSGQQVTVRGISGTVSNAGNNNTLAWTEKGIGIRITANLSNSQLVQLANSLV
jgi:outer membrane lipoprotein-sorting protein